MRYRTPILTTDSCLWQGFSTSLSKKRRLFGSLQRLVKQVLSFPVLLQSSKIFPHGAGELPGSILHAIRPTYTCTCGILGALGTPITTRSPQIDGVVYVDF